VKVIPERFSYKVTGKCKNLNLSFTDIEIQDYWKYKEYSLCPKPSSAVYFKKNRIVTKCVSGDPEFLIDPGYSQRLGGVGYGIFWKDSLSLTPKSEFLIVRCSKTDYFAFVFNRFNASISQKAKEIQSSLGMIKEKPLTVLILVFDSVSRGSAYRNWPKSMNFLTSLRDSTQNYSFFDFENALVSGVHTRPNMVPIIYGQSESFHQIFLKNEKYDSLWPSEKFLKLQEKAIWSYYSSLGYTTMFLYDTIYDYMVKSLGRQINADHVFVNFWKIVYRVFGFSDFSSRQRCIGSEDSHFYSLNYTFQYLTNYKENNRFAYVHLDAAHENSGNVRTVDKDLKWFMQNTFEWYSRQGQEIVIFLIGDHGRINPALQFNIRGFLDQRTPMTFLIASRSLIQNLAVEPVVKWNEKELVGRFDIHLSIKDIANYPYAHWNHSQYLKQKIQLPVYDVVSLFREKANPLRTCSDLAVKKIDCTCKDYEKVDFSNEETVLSNIFKLSQQFIKKKEKKILKNCEKSWNFELISAEKFELLPFERGWDTIYLLYFKVNWKVLVKTVTNFCKFDKIRVTRNILSTASFPIAKYQVNKTEVFSQVTELEVLSQDFNESLCIFKI
jgi:hypothetical protein